MPTGFAALPQLEADVFLTDGGLETTLIFDDGIELADFAAFTLVDDPAGRAALVRYFDRYARIVDAAREVGLPVVISFTVETDGTLPSGEALGAAIEAVDTATEGNAAYFMVDHTHIAAISAACARPEA